jgi:hypothetical protein
LINPDARTASVALAVCTAASTTAYSGVLSSSSSYSATDNSARTKKSKDLTGVESRRPKMAS